MKKILAYIMAGVLASACIYPYEIADPELETLLIIEGDIIVGGTTEIDVRYLQKLNSYTGNDNEARPKGTCWIEDQKKLTTMPYISEDGHYVFDTSNLQKSRQYRVVYADNGTGNTYSSPLQNVYVAPKIDELYYRTDDDNVEILLDLDGGKTGRYFRWDWTQTWEYTADFAPTCYFDPETASVQYFDISGTPNYDYYYCWNNADCKDIGLGQVPSLQTTSTLKAQKVITIERTNKKFSSLYRLELKVRGISYGDLQYLQNMKDISSDSGSLFSPNPSDIAGNITSSDPDERVIGYINVCTEAVDTIYIKSSDVYIRPNFETQLFIPDTSGELDLTWYYNYGYRPVFLDEWTNKSQWASLRCVDCRGYGGTKDKPLGWPTNNE